MRSTLARLATGSILVLALVACPATPSASVLGVTIDGGDRTVAVGDTVPLIATVATTGSASDVVTWSSTFASVATIGDTGTLEALAPGATTITATSAADPNQSGSIAVTVVLPGALAWTRQLGTTEDDVANGMATDADGNVYAAGYTRGDLEGTSGGGFDAFVRSYDSNGTVRWTRQFSSGTFENASAIATDADGAVYVVGNTLGGLAGPNVGGDDAFVRSYDRDGVVRWTRQYGTVGTESARGVATDANGDVYVAGGTFGALDGTNAGGFDAYVRSYDGDGTLRWTRQFGTSGEDSARAVATDADGNVYAIGSTSGALEGTNAGGYDVFVRSYDSDGTLRWTRQFGTGTDDLPEGIATDADGNVYAIGTTSGALEGPHAGGTDVFVRSFDSSGTLRWTRQFGTGADDVAGAIAVNANGHVFAAGATDGALDGASAGGRDAFVRSFDRDGNHRWTRQFGTSGDERARAIATDANGSVYAAGGTTGDLADTNAGGEDAFIRKYGP